MDHYETIRFLYKPSSRLYQSTGRDPVSFLRDNLFAVHELYGPHEDQHQRGA